MFRYPLVVLALLAAAAPGLAQPGPRVVKMTLHPAGPSTPAMKYALLPEVRDLRPGNAAIFYHRSHSPEWEHGLARYPEQRNFQEWLDLPPDRGPVGKLHIFVTMPQELVIAARTEHWAWQMLSRLRADSPMML